MLRLEAKKWWHSRIAAARAMNIMSGTPWHFSEHRDHLLPTLQETSECLGRLAKTCLAEWVSCKGRIAEGCHGLSLALQGWSTHHERFNTEPRLLSTCTSGAMATS